MAKTQSKYLTEFFLLHILVKICNFDCKKVLFCSYLTDRIPRGQAKCSHPKWPTMNFIALNRSFGSWEWLIKIFPDFSHGKGEIFALKVWFFWKKWIKSCTSLESWGIEPQPPGWKSGILSTILWKLIMKLGVKLGLSYNASDVLVIKNCFYRIVWYYFIVISHNYS